MATDGEETFLETCDLKCTPQPEIRAGIKEDGMVRDRLTTLRNSASESVEPHAVRPLRLFGGVPTTLSPREHEVLSLVAHGMSDREIASRMQISVRTVGAHLYSVRKKLAVGNRTGAVVAAQRLGLLPSLTGPEVAVPVEVTHQPTGATTDAGDDARSPVGR